jgi:chitin synthase
MPPTKLKNDGYAESRTASLYGRETYYEPRGHSPSPSQTGMMLYAPPGYASGRNTPLSASHLRAMSEVHQPLTSRPVTNYLDMNIPTSPDSVPSDSELDQAVQSILRSADLNSVTKREIRRKLEDHFGMDLTSRKAAINQAIDRILLSHAQ